MKISQVLYINLDHRHDRLKSIKEVLLKCPHPTHRISAIQPNDQDIRFDKIICQQHISQCGILGCILSHIKCLEYLLSQNLPKNEYYMVLEDDVLIHPSFWALLDTIMLDTDADIIFFDSCRKESYYGLHCMVNDRYPITYKLPRGNSCIDHKIAHQNNVHSCFHGTHCIVYHNEKLANMLQYLQSITTYKSIDIQLFTEKKLNRYIVQTGLIYQDHMNLDSDINRNLKHIKQVISSEKY